MGRALIAASVFAGLGVACHRVSPVDGAIAPGGDGGDGDVDGDADTDAPFGDCTGGFGDPSSGLCWQEPPANPMSWWDGRDYCDGLEIDGAAGWRLPAIDELRTLIRGCDPTAPAGDCPVQPGSASDAADESCAGCADLGGPGPGGCYWPDVLGASCPAWYWSGSELLDNATFVWNVSYVNGHVAFVYKDSVSHVRCVRTGE